MGANLITSQTFSFTLYIHDPNGAFDNWRKIDPKENY